MEMNAAQIRREDCRLAVLDALYQRQTGAHEATAIKTVFLKRHDFTLTEVEEALNFLKGLGFVTAIPEPLGSTEAWQITAQGILHRERTRK